ncbi:MAG: prepilin-type N-terminal cleavage/methylation domain-containing protein [bacterium]
MISQHHKKGFTLIELLVVIAIIAILAAILFPVFARAREKARQTTCTSNQRQIAASVQMYAQDHEETFPAPATIWADLKLDPGVLICPTMGKSATNGYCANGMILSSGIGQIDNPSAVPLTFDGQAVSLDTTPPFPSAPNVATWISDYDYRHSKQMVISYVDGHVGTSAKLRGTFPDRYKTWMSYDFQDGLYPFGTLPTGWQVMDDPTTTSGNKVLYTISPSTGAWAENSYNKDLSSTLGKRFKEIFMQSPAVYDPVEYQFSFRGYRIAAAEGFYYSMQLQGLYSGWSYEAIGNAWSSVKTGPYAASTAATAFKSCDYSGYPAFKFLIKPGQFAFTSALSINLNWQFHVKTGNAGTVQEKAYFDDFLLREVLPG